MVRSTSRRALGLELTSPTRLIAPRVRSWDVERGLTGGLAGNLAGRGLCEGHGKDTGDRGQRGSHVARSNVGGFVNNRHLWLKSMRARGDLNLKRARVRVRSRRYSLAATAHFMERDMQAILCVVVTVFATGVVCDYAPCANALRREKHAPRRFPTGRIDRPCTFSANQIAFLRRSRY